MPEYGIRLPVVGPLASRSSVIETARRCERLGYHTVWLQDVICWSDYQNETHISSGSREALDAAGSHPPNFLEALTTLGFLAGVTETVRIGVAVLCLPYRSPIVAAKEIANIDFLSEGRLTLGIGTGAPKVIHNVDFEVLGVLRKTKYERTRDYLRAMITVWTQDEASYDGEFVSFEGAPIYPKPVQEPHPPIWYGGSGPTGVDVTAEFATGWISLWITPDEYPARIEDLKERARAKGRDVEFTVATEIMASIDSSVERARENAAQTLGILPEGYGTQRTDPEKVFQSSLVGSPASIGEQIVAYSEAGVDHFEMKFIYHSILHLNEQLDMFAEEVMPLVAAG